VRPTLLAICAACYSPSFPQGLLCSQSGECPPDQTCGDDGTCHGGSGGDLIVDASPIDQVVIDGRIDGRVDAALPACPSTHTCAEEAPLDWSGPLAVSLGDTSPACVGSYPTDAGSYFTDLDPGTALCGCSCGPASGIQCAAGADLCYVNLTCSVGSCIAPSATLLPAQCTSIPDTSAPMVRVSARAPTNVGGCAANANHTLPTAVWGTQVQACGGATTIPTACANGEVCSPLAVTPFEKLCIQRTGEHDCPSQSYSEKVVVYEDFTDTRACSACSCGPATSSCRGEVDFTYPGGGQSCGSLANTVAAGSCGAMNNLTQTATYSPNPSGSCTASASTLSGGVTQNGPVTFCCRP
jgi:hypothetical protein